MFCDVLICIFILIIKIFDPFADGAVETVITFDQGAKWQKLRRPQDSHCDTETSSNRPNRVGNIYNVK